MPRQKNRVMDDLLPGYGKIRKRGCSSSSSSSSKVHNYRFKRAILVGKSRSGVAGSRSSTPAPSWKMKLGAAVESPRSQNGGGKSRPVTARKLAATLWEMNDMPSPGVRENLEMRKEMKVRERMKPPLHSAPLPPHLSDPSHIPLHSERMDRSVMSALARHRKTSSISHKLRVEDHNGGVYESLSNTSLMEIESRSRAQTPNGSVVADRTRLKDVSNALTTSKELLRIINRMWAHENQPSFTMSLISALHAELERARLQVNQFIKEKCSDQSEINYLLKCFAEEKASWKHKERKAIEAAIESIAGELEVERKLRCRFEGLNKKLGKELAETKSAFSKALKELESEKRVREIMEQVCDELATDIGEDRAEAEELKRESAKVHEEVEREREMLQLADKLREERVQMKLAEAKHHFEEKNAFVDKLRNQLEAFLGNRGGKTRRKGCDLLHPEGDEEIASYLSRSNLGSFQTDERDAGEVENGEVDCEDDSGESDLHSIELNVDNGNKSLKWTHAPAPGYDEIKARNSISGKAQRKSTPLQRSISDGVEWGIEVENRHDSGDVYQENPHEFQKQAHRKSHGDDMQRYKSVKGLLRDHILSSSSRSMVQERPLSAQGSSASKSRLSDAKAETQTLRTSKK